MNRIYWVRHGENPANVTKELSYRRLDYPLNERGIAQARQTAVYFADKGIDEIHASPLRRAAQTGRIIADALHLPVCEADEFREINIGSLEDDPASPASWAEYLRICRDWFAGRPDSRFSGGEDYHMLWARMAAGLARITADKDNRRIVIAAHSGGFMAILRDLCPALPPGFLEGRPMPNGSITQLDVELRNGRPVAELVSWASAEHLSGEATPGVTLTGQLARGAAPGQEGA